MIKPVLLLDMDGPLADFDRLFFDRCAEMGWNLNATFETQTARYAHEHLVEKAEQNLAREMVHTPGWFRDLPIKEGAVEGLQVLMDHGLDIWIVTKPLEANPTCRDEKAAWVKKHLGNHWEERLIIASDKSLVRGDVLLDDAPKHAWIPRATWKPVIFPAPWNGPGSQWGDYPRWNWGDPVAWLLYPEVWQDATR